MLNLADLMTLITVVGCPIAAGAAAASEKAGWLTIVWILFGVALGMGFGYCVHKLAYCFLLPGQKQRASFRALLLLAYVFVTPIVALGFIILSGVTTSWLAEYVF